MKSKCRVVNVTFVLLATIALTAAKGSNEGVLVGSETLCHLGREHLLEYKVLHSSSAHLYDLDTLDHVHGLDCDIDGSALQIHFGNDFESAEVWAKWSLEDAFLVGGDTWGCPFVPDPTKGFLLRAIVSARLSGDKIVVSTAPAQYDQVFEDADISFGPTGEDCGDNLKDVEACIGMNVDDSCTSAAADIPIYSNDVTSLSCDDCFVVLAADIFLSLSIHSFQLSSLSAGLRNVTARADVDLAMTATKQWSVGVDKDLTLINKTPLITFKVGAVPFIVWFAVPVEMKMDASLQTTATGNAGVSAVYNIGDYYIEWDPTNHWSHVTPTPTLSFDQHASGDATFEATALFSLTPSFELHANQMFTYTMTLDPQLNLDIKGDLNTKQICETTSYTVTLTSFAELKLNIDWLHIHEDKIWGPTEVWTKSGNISNKCFNASA